MSSALPPLPPLLSLLYKHVLNPTAPPRVGADGGGVGGAITDAGAELLASAMRKNKTLTAIDLGQNEITMEGAAHLARAFAVVAHAGASL